MATITADAFVRDEPFESQSERELTSMVCLKRERIQSIRENGSAVPTDPNGEPIGLNRIAAVENELFPHSPVYRPPSPYGVDDPHVEVLVVNEYPPQVTEDWLEGRLAENDVLGELDAVVGVNYYAAHRDPRETAKELRDEVDRLVRTIEERTNKPAIIDLDEKRNTLTRVHERVVSRDVNLYNCLTTIVVQSKDVQAVEQAVAEVKRDVERSGGSVISAPSVGPTSVMPTSVKPTTTVGRENGAISPALLVVALGIGIVVVALLRRFRNGQA